MTVSRFGYQGSFHLQCQKTRVPKSVTILPDQSWIHIPATLKSSFNGLHQVSPEFHALLHPQGASALYPCHPGPREWPRCTPSLEVQAAQDSRPESGVIVIPFFTWTYLNDLHEGWLYQNIEGTCVADCSVNPQPKVGLHWSNAL